MKVREAKKKDTALPTNMESSNEEDFDTYMLLESRRDRPDRISDK